MHYLLKILRNKNSVIGYFRRRMSFNYPEARRDETVKDRYFGIEVADPYRWLEDPDSEETKAFVDAQNAITRPYLDECPYKDQIKEEITKLWNYPKFSTPYRHGNKYYQYRNTGLQNQSVIFVQDSLHSEAKVFLDPNAFSEDGTVALSGTAFSEDGSVLAYGISSSGSDWIEIKFKNVETGEDYDEVLKKVKYSRMAWMHDNKGFFYGGYLHQTGKTDGSETKSSENQKLYYHKLGTSQSDDIMTVEFEDEQLRMGADVSNCGSYLVITPIKGCKNNLLYFTKLQANGEITGKLELTPVVTEFVADFEYVTNTGTKFVFRTNKDAPNYRIIVIDFENPSEDKWVDLIPEHSKDVLNWAYVVNTNMIVVCYLRDVKNAMAIYDLKTGQKIYDFKLDVGTISAISGKHYHKEIFYSFYSFLTPNIIYRVTFDEGNKINEEVFHETKVGDFDPSIYETQQVFYKSKDGTDIPMFIVNKKGFERDGKRPCLLYGYGGFNVNLTPYFGVSRLVFINNFDGIFALANIRGGGEYGDKWHNGGRFENKQSCFDDFQYAAKYLVQEKYTSVDKLTIQGGSNGGLLVAACINQAPELFGAAICQVGVLDMLRYHKFTIGYAWKSDYGCSDEEEQFEYLYKYSPLHNIQIPKEGSQYPATLLLTADHDDRVVPLHSLKFIAELQHKVGKIPHQKNPLMIRIETRAGHGAGKPTSKIIDEIADYFSFISKALSIKYAPNTTIASKDIRDVIKFSQALPGTKYDFWLYYSNATHNTLTWTANFTTVPDPPSGLSVNVRSGKTAIISWDPPSQGSFTSFKLKINPLVHISDQKQQAIVIDNIDNTVYTLKDLVPGATYQVQAFTVFENKESAAYTSRNFTTKPNTPGKFIVWFRNETTLLVLWQPPYPAAIYTHYKVSIDPPDANDSILYVEKEGEPPGPAQAAFKGLVPGRAYNISVQTMSEDEISTPTTAQYRTVPLKPQRIFFDRDKITTHSFVVHWEPPSGKSEFDKYQISLGTVRKPPPVPRSKEDPTFWEFKDNLEAGRTYSVVIKTVSGKVTSWPVTGDVTLKPLPVKRLRSKLDEKTGTITIFWHPDPESTQEGYMVSYHEVESTTGDSNTVTTNQTEIDLEALLPGRNYSITVQAMSKDQQSLEETIYVVTKPSAPIIEDLRPMVDGLNISWKSDVNSKQDKYEVQWIRNDTNERNIRTTYESKILLSHLYPGAGYLVKVFAISHGLKSEPHEYFQPVFPRPPRNMSIEKTTTNSVIVQWSSPTDSLISEYAIRYRTDSDNVWVRLPAVPNTEAEVTDMTPGERYTIQVNTVSYGLESNEPQQLNHTVRPNPVSNIAPLVDSNNVTLEWPRPEGRVETYIVKWRESANPTQVNKRNVSQNQNGTGPVRLLVGDLMPGVEYIFEIQAISNNLESDITVLSTRTMPLIQSEVVVVNNQQSTDSISLRYTPTPPSSSVFDIYRFSLSESNIPDQEKAANDSDRLVTFTGLVPGRLYNITVWTVSKNVASQPLQRQDRLYPEPITGINATYISDTEITLTWSFPRGEYNAFEVQYLTTENVFIQNLTRHNSITINDLKPHRNYTFTVIVRSGTESSILRRSLPVSAIFTTKESVPGKVDKFEPVDIQPSDIIFEWTLPMAEQNGVIRKFTVTYGQEGSPHTLSRNFSPSEFRGIIRQLIPGKTYIFKIQAETRVGFGPETVWKQKMPILAPPKPSMQVVPTEVCKSSTTIQIRFRKNYFSDVNGPVRWYAIIVAEDHSKNASGLEMPSWRDVQAYSVWPPYQVMDPYYPFSNNSVEDFTIGGESCDIRQVGYCNGPLKSGSTYRVKIRAFTAPDKFTDTSYSFPIQTDQDNTPIVLGIVVPLVLIAVLFITIIFIRRRRSAGKRKATEARANDNMSLPDSVIETSRPVRIENFSNHYRVMSADSDFRFSEEFEELKHVGRDQPCTFADLPCNRPKNRFTNILPYDHSRFKLQPVDDEEGSDYINANYVPGYNSPREFVVTQGPLHSTRDDFWRMVWESNSRAIIMLTRCVEKGREKCDHYWPYDTMPVYYGDISVQILNESRYPDWNVSEFMVCRGDIQRVVRHFHFSTWPDFGVPNPPHTLVRFVRAFRERVPPDQRPIVVHCSAGVGRSGTFICLDRILQQIQISDYVDIFGIVFAMRKERVWMVQTEQQYICIHQCLLAVLEGKDLSSSPREIHDNQGFEDDEGIAESGM